jgi:hypothetical protein
VGGLQSSLRRIQLGAALGLGWGQLRFTSKLRLPSLVPMPAGAARPRIIAQVFAWGRTVRVNWPVLRPDRAESGPSGSSQARAVEVPRQRCCPCQSAREGSSAPAWRDVSVAVQLRFRPLHRAAGRLHPLPFAPTYRRSLPT